MMGICVEVWLGLEVSEWDARQDRLCVAVDGEDEGHTDGAGSTSKFRVSLFLKGYKISQHREKVVKRSK